MKRLFLSVLTVFALDSLCSAADPPRKERLVATLAKLAKHDPESPSFDATLTAVDYLDDERHFLDAAQGAWDEAAGHEYFRIAFRRAQAGLVQCAYVTDRFRKLVAEGKATDADQERELREIQAAAKSAVTGGEPSPRLADATRDPMAAERPSDIDPLAAALRRLERHDPTSPEFDPSLTETDYLTDKNAFLEEVRKAPADRDRELCFQALGRVLVRRDKRLRAERDAKRVESELKSAVNMYNAGKRNARFAAEREADWLANLPPTWYVSWPSYMPSYWYGGYGSSYGGYGGYGSDSLIGYSAGGYYTGFGYQPWSSFTYGSPYGGAATQYYGGFMGPGFYLPYTFSGYMPAYYGGWGWGGAF